MSTYKAKILSYLEYRTPAIYHASSTLLQQIDSIQSKFLREIGINPIEALLEYHLAPLNARRDMGMLGLVHRTVLGLGPPHFQKYFKLAEPSLHPTGRNTLTRHSFQLMTYRTGKFLDVLGQSVLGLVDIYNLLPQFVVNAPTVKVFQRRVQHMLRTEAESGNDLWHELFSPRKPLWNHKLVAWRLYREGNNEFNSNTVNATECATSTCVNGWLSFGSGICGR